MQPCDSSSHQSITEEFNHTNYEEDPIFDNMNDMENQFFVHQNAGEKEIIEMQEQQLDAGGDEINEETSQQQQNENLLDIDNENSGIGHFNDDEEEPPLEDGMEEINAEKIVGELFIWIVCFDII